VRTQPQRNEAPKVAGPPPKAQPLPAFGGRVAEMLPDPDAPVLPEAALALHLPPGPAISFSGRDQAEARYRVIEPLLTPERFRALWLDAGWSRTKLVATLAAQHRTSQRTIYTWLRRFRARGLPGLANRDRTDRGKPRALTNAALDFLLAAALPCQGSYGELTVREIYRAYCEERAWRAAHAAAPLEESERHKYARYLDNDRLSAEAQLPEASYETFRRWFRRIPHIVRVMAREGEEAYQATQEVLSFRQISDLKPLDYVVMDHRRLDLFCLVETRSRDGGPRWRLIRPWLTAAIDMRTRKWLTWAIVETPSSDSIASVLKRAFLDHGIPQAVYWDNGKDFTCEWLEGRSPRTGAAYRIAQLGDGMRGVLHTLGVRVHHAIVRRARSKIIEPNFLNTALFDRTTPFWCGHKPSARPERFLKLVEQHERWLKAEARETPFRPIEFIAGLYDEFLEALNEREHTGEGMETITPRGRGWLSPNECWERLIGSVERRVVPPEVLQFCFARRRQVTVRHGEVAPSFGGRQFHYRLAGNPVALAALNGRQVDFAYDPHDLGTAAVYYEDRFVGLVDNVELRRMGESAFVADERARRAMRREVKAFIAAVHQRVHVPTPEERALRRIEQRDRRAAAPPAPLLPRPEVRVDVPDAIVSAAAAAAEEAGFRFSDPGDPIEAAEAAAYRDDDPDDGTDFRFFESV